MVGRLLSSKVKRKSHPGGVKMDPRLLACAATRSLQPAELDLESGRQQQIVLLQSRWRIRKVTIAQRQLPTDASRDVGDKRGVEVDPVGTAVREVGKEEQLLLERNTRTEAVRKRLPELCFGRAAIVEVAFEVLAVPVDTSEEIELCSIVANRVIAETAAE